jgi:hypothetical protein
MKSIDELYKRLGNAEVKAPDVWNKVSQQMAAPAASSVKGAKAVTATLTKVALIIAGVAVVGVATYFIARPAKHNDSKTQIAQTTLSINQTATTTMKSMTQNTTNKDSKTIIVSNKIQIQPLQSISTEFSITDKQTNAISAPQIHQSQSSLCCKENSLTPHAQYQQLSQNDKEEEKVVPQTLQELRIPSVITPNGDGINDVFEIKNLDLYPENTLTIFDGRGKEVFKANGYKNNFTASNIPSGTYFYILKYKCLDKFMLKNGSLTVIRN